MALETQQYRLVFTSCQISLNKTSWNLSSNLEFISVVTIDNIELINANNNRPHWMHEQSDQLFMTSTLWARHVQEAPWLSVNADQLSDLLWTSEVLSKNRVRLLDQLMAVHTTTNISSFVIEYLNSGGRLVPVATRNPAPSVVMYMFSTPLALMDQISEKCNRFDHSILGLFRCLLMCIGPTENILCR